MTNRSYRELIDQTIVNCEFFKETIQSTGTLAVTLDVVSSYRFSKSMSMPCLLQKADSECLRASTNVAPAADCTSDFTFEWAGIPTNCNPSGNYYIWMMGVTTGGIQWRWRGDIGILYLNMYTSAGVLARQIYNTTAIPQYNLLLPHHFVMQSRSGGTAGSLWINGSNTSVSLGSSGTVARGADDRWYTVGINGSRTSNYLFRSWQSALSEDEVQVLYRNYSDLTIPSKV